MRRLQAAIRLAAKMGAGLAGREILFRTLSRRRATSRAPGRLTMLRKDMKTGLAPTADPAEIARFDALAEDWWNPDGRMKLVHSFNAARVAHLRKRLPALMVRDARLARPLNGMTLLDVGCGAGLVTEPMARLGAAALGIDAAERNIRVASLHADKAGLPIDYRQAVPEELVAEGRQFDIVLSLEVVEHVADTDRFLEATGRLVAPGGLLVIGTLNRTLVSFVKAIIGAEYVLGWLPCGTHDWRRFMRPDEIARTLAPLGFSVVETCGLELAPIGMRWHTTRSCNTNYLQIHRRRGEPTAA
jgi:2-polyprenyl-6-hydroxyphenyl methylase/3-demethylubiquinone-9 3-methyltransferase